MGFGGIMQVGDLVINPPSTHWGIGIVIAVETITGGLSAQVQWNDGGTMWVWLKHLEAL